MFKLFKKPQVEVIDNDAMVRQIHNEIDSLEDKAVKQVEEFLKTLEAQDNDNLLRKSALMTALGFPSGNETVRKGVEFKTQQTESKKMLEALAKYRLEYPGEKIIPITDFETVLKKYGLTWAPISRYIKDVPEKNLLELQKSKSNRSIHVPVIEVVDEIGLSWGTSDEIKAAVNSLISIINENPSTEYANKVIMKHLPEYYKKMRAKNEDPCRWMHTKKANLSGIYIAAPKSHFELGKMREVNGGYLEGTAKINIEDPIAFEFLNDGSKDHWSGNTSKPMFVRIKTKWGTSDDQSYLDPLVQNEDHN